MLTSVDNSNSILNAFMAAFQDNDRGVTNDGGSS